MANSWTHAVSSARRFGGKPEAYLALHEWFDASKSAYADWRHRALRHHTLGIWWSQEVFGPYIEVEVGTLIKQVPTRLIGEQHVIEDCGFIPTVEQWLKSITPEPWMLTGARKLSRELEQSPGAPALPGLTGVTP